jgi:hypothetical protein
MEVINKCSYFCLPLYLNILQNGIYFLGAGTVKHPVPTTKSISLTSKKPRAILLRHNNVRDPYTNTRNGFLAFFRNLAAARSFTLHHEVQEGSVVHPASYFINNPVIFESEVAGRGGGRRWCSLLLTSI